MVLWVRVTRTSILRLVHTRAWLFSRVTLPPLSPPLPPSPYPSSWNFATKLTTTFARSPPARILVVPISSCWISRYPNFIHPFLQVTFLFQLNMKMLATFSITKFSNSYFSSYRIDSSLLTLNRSLSRPVFSARKPGIPLISTRFRMVHERKRERECNPVETVTSPRNRGTRSHYKFTFNRVFGINTPAPIVIIPDGCNYRRGNIRLHVVESLRAVHVITFPSFGGLN